ncbi:class I SAM-dependent methyltransferase [Gillisia sp. Q332]|uniref:class I SAM-dependent methyltransferase n=1 Tax=Gillisia xinjiangensis TaxID=3384765 RepID=UPI00391D5D72
MKNIKKYIKKSLPKPMVTLLQRQKLKYWSNYNRNNLNKLAEIYSCDKWGKHFYTPHYTTHFKRFQKKNINLLEIGIGGYDDPNIGGASLRMWKKYFRKGNIYGIDIHDKSLLEEKRIKTFQGSQTDSTFLYKIAEHIGKIDVIIDDGSHINDDIIKTFNHLFPFLNKGGIYVVEDLQTSYWNWYGGNSEDLNDSKTGVNYFKNLIHGLNHKEFLKEGYEPNYFDKHIISMHFYHNMVFIYKGDNIEESNHLINNQIPGYN